MTSISIPNSVTEIGDGAFSHCYALTSFTVPEGVTVIDYGFFAWSRNLSSITIPDGVTTIGDYAFAGCTALATLNIPEKVTSVGAYAFLRCSGLKELYCNAENVPETGEDAFYYSSCSEATLHVPAASVEAYKGVDGWKDFGKIVAIGEETAITSTTSEEAETINVYDMNGRKLSMPQKGLNLIRMSNGQIRKVLAK